MKPNRPIKNVQIRESDCKTIYKILSPILTQGIDVEIRTSPKGIKVIQIPREVVGEANINEN